MFTTKGDKKSNKNNKQTNSSYQGTVISAKFSPYLRALLIDRAFSWLSTFVKLAILLKYFLSGSYGVYMANRKYQCRSLRSTWRKKSETKVYKPFIRLYDVRSVVYFPLVRDMQITSNVQYRAYRRRAGRGEKRASVDLVSDWSRVVASPSNGEPQERRGAHVVLWYNIFHFFLLLYIISLPLPLSRHLAAVVVDRRGTAAAVVFTRNLWSPAAGSIQHQKTTSESGSTWSYAASHIEKETDRRTMPVEPHRIRFCFFVYLLYTSLTLTRVVHATW